MRVFVLKQVEDSDILVRVVSEAKGISPVYRLLGRAAHHAGNPYGVYGDCCAHWSGIDKFSLSIQVFAATSGCLVPERGTETEDTLSASAPTKQNDDTLNEPGEGAFMSYFTMTDEELSA